MKQMEYRDFFARLVKMHSIPDERITTFTARLHSLRKSGALSLGKVGKGSRLTYTSDVLAEAHLGLLLSSFGLPPLKIVKVLDLMRGKEDWWPLTRWGDDWLVVGFRATFDTSIADAEDQFTCNVQITKEPWLLQTLKGDVGSANCTIVLSLRKLGDDLRSVADGVQETAPIDELQRLRAENAELKKLLAGRGSSEKQNLGLS
jgi:hypothetical protein